MANMSPSIVKNYAQRKASVRTKWQLYVLCVCWTTRGAPEGIQEGSKTFHSHASMAKGAWSGVVATLVKWRSYGTLVAKSN